MKQIRSILYFLTLLFFAQSGYSQLIVNEVSQGSTTAREYIELLVMGNRSCTDSTADLRGWIVDDNNGWLGNGSGQGIASGCLRFANDPVWAQVPYGSIILLYDDVNKNPSITLADDETDANKDYVYVVPVSSLRIEENIVSPSPPSSLSYVYPTTNFNPGGTWDVVGLANGGDGVLTVSPANRSAAYFSIGYGTINNSSNATVYQPTAGSGTVYYLNDALFNASASWVAGTSPTDETPGAANTAANAAWINAMRQNPLAAQSQTVILNGCNSLVYNGVTYTSNTTIRDTLKTTGGCDSIYRTTRILIRTLNPTNITIQFNVCRSVVFNGVTYTQSAVVKDTLRTVQGCDSVYRTTNINIQDIAPVIENIFLFNCDSVRHNNILYTSSTVVRDSIRTSNGCDSILRIVNIRVTGQPQKDSADVRGCGAVIFEGITYTDSTILRDTIRTNLGCDSIFRVRNIIVRNVVPVNESDTLIGCNNYIFNGVTYTADTVILDTIRTVELCDSIYRENVIRIQTVTPATETLDTTACRFLVYNGTTYNATTSFVDTLQTVLGCDSIYRTVNINILNVVPVTNSTNLTGCNKVTYNGLDYTTSTVLSDTVRTAFGCDSLYNVVNITIRINPTTTTTSFTSCSNVFLNGVNYTTSTVLRDTVRNASGCDSIYRITNINIQNTPLLLTNTISGCGSVVYNGVTYTTSRVLRDTLKSFQFCDSVYRVTNINVSHVTPTSQNNPVSACNSYTLNGITYTTSTSVLDTLRTPEGCDSIYRTNIITIVPIVPVNQDITVTGCNSVSYNGNTYTSSNILTQTILSTGGCDSIYRTVHINVVRPVAVSLTVSGCSSVTFNGKVYTTSATVLDTVKSTLGGCDSLYRTVSIVVGTANPVTNTSTISGCGSVVYNGVTYTTSTTLRDTIRASQTCDSIYNVVDIRVRNIVPTSTTRTLVGCNSLLYNGVTYTAPAVVLDTLRTPEGCDSVYRTNNISIKFIAPVNGTRNLFGCNSLVLNGVTYTASATVVDTVKTAEGCDSVYRTNFITIRTITPAVVATTVSGCNSVWYNGVLYNSNAITRDTIRTSQGCDSIYRLVSIVVKNITPVSQNNTVYGCNSLVFNGVTYTSNATVADTLRTPENCDSVYRTNFIVIRSITPVATTRSLAGCGSVVLNGVTYTTSAVVRDTVRTAQGCDSIYRTNLVTVRNVTPVNGAITRFGCNAVVFNGITYTTSASIRDTIRTAEGCDSVYNVVSIVVKSITAVSQNNVVRGCNSVVFNGTTYTSNATINDTLRTAEGCDSIYRNNQVIVRQISPVSNTRILNGCNSLVFNGVTYTSNATVSDTLRTTEGCDSVYRTNNIVIYQITPVTKSTSVSGCGNVVFNGTTYAASTVVMDTIRTAFGCDSVYNTVSITVRSITPVSQNNVVRGCNSVVFNGTTYTSNATINDTLRTAEGCDSIYRNNQIIVRQISPVSNTRTLNGCNSLVFNGVTYTSNATVSDTLRTTEGCDSVYRTNNIVIYQITPVTKSTSVSGCGSVVFNGTTYTASTVVMDTIRTAFGCDSVYNTVSITVRLITPVSQNNVVRGCNSVVFNGITYTGNATVSDTLRTAEGCDSVFRSNQIIVRQITAVSTTQVLTGCNSLVFNGVTYTSSATVLDTLRTAEGCDSVHRTNTITIYQVTPVTKNASVSGCGSVVFNGTTYSASTVVRDTIRTAFGCDSIFNVTNINVRIIAPVTTTINLKGCNSLVFGGVTYTGSQSFKDTLRTVEGCDSVYRNINITIQTITPTNSIQSLTGCRSVAFNGVNYTNSTIVKDTLRTVFGCDSVYRATTITVYRFDLNLVSSQNPVGAGTNITLQTSAQVAYTITAWEPGSLFSNQQATSQTLYATDNKEIVVRGVSQDGCLDTARLSLVVNKDNHLFIPNTFTPNGDGQNDIFNVCANNVKALDLRIFNQWGQLIYQTNSPTVGWDGRSKGSLQPTGVYVYVTRITFNDNTVVDRKGTINLVK